MENENKGNPNEGGPKFSSYWIYAIIAVFLLGLNFYTMSEGSREPIQYDRLEEMIADNAIEDIIVVTNLKQAQIYLKDSKLTEERYKDAAQGSFSRDRFHYRMVIGSTDQFSDDLKEIQEAEGIPREDWIRPTFETRQDYIGNIPDCSDCCDLDFHHAPRGRWWCRTGLSDFQYRKIKSYSVRSE